MFSFFLFNLFFELFFVFLGLHPWHRGPIGAAAAGRHHSHSHAGSEPRLRPTPQGHARPLTHCVKAGIEHAASWVLMGLFTAEPQWELPREGF